MHLRLVGLLAVLAALAACTNVSAPITPTGTPVGSIAVPTVPPVVVPSVSVPSLDVPSLDIPSNLPSLDIPSLDIPSLDIPSLEIPSGLPSLPAGAEACALVTAAELQTAFGGPTTTVTDEAGACTITPNGELFPLIIRYGDNETIDAAKMIVENGEDLTLGGNRAFYGELMGGILYIEKNGRTLVLQSPLNTELKDTMIRIGELASARF